MMPSASQGSASRGALYRLRAAFFLAFALLCGTLGLTGCGSGTLDHNTRDTPEAVARAVVAGLNARDVEGLRSLSLNEEEFHELVWPKLPTSRPERNVPWDYVWKDLHGKSQMQLQARIHEWEDRGHTVVRVDFTGEATDYGTFRVQRQSVVTLRDRDGRESRGRLFGSMIEQGGRYKVFSYVAD